MDWPTPYIYVIKILLMPGFILKPKLAEANKVICRKFTSFGLSRINPSVSKQLTVQHFKYFTFTFACT
jgi:hypothetical protein